MQKNKKISGPGPVCRGKQLGEEQSRLLQKDCWYHGIRSLVDIAAADFKWSMVSFVTSRALLMFFVGIITVQSTLTCRKHVGVPGPRIDRESAHCHPISRRRGYFGARRVWPVVLLVRGGSSAVSAAPDHENSVTLSAGVVPVSDDRKLADSMSSSICAVETKDKTRIQKPAKCLSTKNKRLMKYVSFILLVVQNSALTCVVCHALMGKSRCS